MKKAITLLKNIRPLKVLTAFMAGMILFFTQACNSGNSVGATTPSQTVPRQIIGEEQHARPNSEVYVPKGSNILSPNEGGMNNFSDVDPRTQGAKVKAKAEELKQNAEQNIQNSSSNPVENTRRVFEDRGEIGKNLQERAGDIKQKAQSSAEDFARGTRKGIENIKENTSDAAKGVARNAQDTAEDTKFNAQRSADKAGQAVNRSLRDANTNAAEKGKEAAENSGNFLEKVGSAIKDAVD